MLFATFRLLLYCNPAIYARASRGAKAEARRRASALVYFFAK
jgi:hypothetical protein